jgi:hypothetical protein
MHYSSGTISKLRLFIQPTRGSTEIMRSLQQHEMCQAGIVMAASTIAQL